ncbi:MAG: hypothetical protein QGI10_09145 [Vicinamibacterales bacterium]|jgi:hypothetical protein|nr:hypothetical protein [Vicinamibacterales bacterium]
MSRVPFNELPPDARLWIFSAERPLSEPERARVLEEVDAFIGQWAVHDVPLKTARDLRYDRFIFVAVDGRAAGASGCSIDALVRRMKGLQAELGVELVNHAPVLYRDGAAIARVSRERFADLVESGSVSQQTVVFDNTLTTVGDVRDGRWELPASASWHGQAFF